MGSCTKNLRRREICSARRTPFDTIPIHFSMRVAASPRGGECPSLICAFAGAQGDLLRMKTSCTSSWALYPEAYVYRVTLVIKPVTKGAGSIETSTCSRASSTIRQNPERELRPFCDVKGHPHETRHSHFRHDCSFCRTYGGINFLGSRSRCWSSLLGHSQRPRAHDAWASLPELWWPARQVTTTPCGRRA